MEKIKNTNENKEPKSFGKTIENFDSRKKKFTKHFFNNTGLYISLLLVFVVIVVSTTNVIFGGQLKIAELGLTVFILFFCSYSMYVNCADSGSKAGKECQEYIDEIKDYNTLKKGIIEDKKEIRLTEFCRYYVEEELKSTRESILEDIDYETYEKLYLGKDDEYIKSLDLSQIQINSIIEANHVKAIKLTKTMIMKRGRGNYRRNPLGMRPTTKKGIQFGVKFITLGITTLLTGVMVLEALINPSWATVVSCMLKVLIVVLNGVAGYKMGYENITVDTINYVSDQKDLLYQFLRYIETHPAKNPNFESENDSSDSVAEEDTASASTEMVAEDSPAENNNNLEESKKDVK